MNVLRDFMKLGDKIFGGFEDKDKDEKEKNTPLLLLKDHEELKKISDDLDEKKKISIKELKEIEKKIDAHKKELEKEIEKHWEDVYKYLHEKGILDYQKAEESTLFFLDGVLFLEVEGE